jgi:hypothetical protein
MSFGAVIRIMIVVGWATLFIGHIVKHAAPGLGLTERNAFATALATNLGRTYVYTVQRQTTAKPQRIGECSRSFQRNENGFELETILHLDDLGMLAPPGIIALFPSLSDKSSRQLHVRMTEYLNAERQLIRLEGSGKLFGLEAQGEGDVTAAGLTGSYRIDGGTPTPFSRSEITSTVSNGNDFAVTLPPGLIPGDRFTSRMVSPDISKFTLSAATAVYTVEPKEVITTTTGKSSLLRVSMQVENRPVATLWCDDSGTVYRSHQQDGMELMLTSIRENGGGIIWPPAVANSL